MADPVAGVEKIVKLGLAIKQAVDTVRHNEEECREIRKRVLRCSAILSQLQQTGMMNDSPAMSGALEDLEESLQHALELVTACQERSTIVRRLIKAGNLSKQLHRVKDDILNKVMLASFAVNTQATIVLHTIQGGGGGHPPPRQPEHRLLSGPTQGFSPRHPVSFADDFPHPACELHPHGSSTRCQTVLPSAPPASTSLSQLMAVLWPGPPWLQLERTALPALRSPIVSTTTKLLLVWPPTMATSPAATQRQHPFKWATTCCWQCALGHLATASCWVSWECFGCQQALVAWHVPGYYLHQHWTAPISFNCILHAPQWAFQHVPELNDVENSVIAGIEVPMVPSLVAIREFRWSELKVATNSFSDGNIIALGGSFIIYKGVLKGGNIIAVKRCYSGYYAKWPHKNYDLLLAVSKLQHENIVKFVGYCYQGRPRETEFLWVEEYMANGSLQDIIHDSRLHWSSLFQIIHGIAKGLHYLHEQRLVHMDVKPHNIILDSDMNPKITDFELSIVLPDNDITLVDSIMGTVGYIDPECMVEGIVSTKNDVYAFGITLLETVSSMCRSKPPRQDWEAWKAELLKEDFDPALFEASDLKQIRRCMQIGLLCADLRGRRRPNMDQVLEMLNGNKKLPNIKKPACSRDDWLVVNLSTRLFHVKHSVKKWMRSFRGQSAEVSENVLQINELQFAGTRAGRRICRRHP
uniref:non-specific serine/threonine protein kinase n=1 Tax=Setaria viridis TaxID=4556 RepID=A0A4U6TX23_SETVI|nr:hypothetical protein SEVIR_8G237000v2 [Setaria viridis]